MPSLGIISNPHSKSNKKHPDNINQLSYILGKSGTMEITRNLSDLDRACDRFCTDGVDMVAVNGGDGTISKTLTAIVHAYTRHGLPLPRIALLGGGTINVLVKNLGLTSSPRLNLLRLCERYSEPEVKFEEVRIRSLNVEDQYGFLYADGICYHFLKEFYRGRKSPFLSMILLLKLIGSVISWGKLAQKILRLEPRKVTVYPKGEHIRRPLLSVMAATIPRIPFGIKLFPGMSIETHTQIQGSATTETKESFEISLFFSEPRTAALRIPAMLSVYEWIYKNDKRRLEGDRVKLSHDTDSTSSRLPYEYSLDGELFEAKTSEIEVKLGPEIVFVRY